MRETKLFSQKTREQLKKFIAFRAKNPEDTEEILQETLISAYQSIPFFKAQSSLLTWLCGIAKHEIADLYRKKKIKEILFSRLPFLENLVDQALGPEEEIIEKELKRKVKRALAGLTEGYRAVLRLKYIEGNSVVQIAQRLGLTYKATESRLTRARLAFRKSWIEDAEIFPPQKSRLKTFG